MPIGTSHTLRSQGVVGGLVEGVTGDAVALGGAHDPLGVEAGEDLAEAVVLGADEAPAGTRTSSKNSGVLLVGGEDLHGDDVRPMPGASVSDDEQRELAPPGGLVDAGAGDDQHLLGLVDPGDVVLRAARRYSSPSRVAVVEILWEFEPASGSVMAKAILTGPRPAILGSQVLLLLVGADAWR